MPASTACFAHKSEIAAGGPFAIVALVDRLCLLLFPQGGQFRLRAETGIGKTLANQLLCEALINFPALTLLVGAVYAALRAEPGDPLIRRNTESSKAGDDCRDAALYLALFIRIFNAQEEYAVCRLRGEAGRHGGKQAANVKIACRAWRKTRHARPFWKLAGGILFLILLRRPRNVGKKQLGEPFVVSQRSSSL